MARYDSTAQPTLEQRARRRVRLKKGLFIHALVFVLVNGGLYLMSVASGWGLGGDSGWGHRHGGGMFFPLWGWALGLAIHGAVVVLRLQGDGMTERMVDREIETLKRRDGSNAGSAASGDAGGDKPAR